MLTLALQPPGARVPSSPRPLPLLVDADAALLPFERPWTAAALADAALPTLHARWLREEHTPPTPLDLAPLLLKLAQDLVAAGRGAWSVALVNHAAPLDRPLAPGHTPDYTLRAADGPLGVLHLPGGDSTDPWDSEAAPWTLRLTATAAEAHAPLLAWQGLHPTGLDPTLEALLRDPGPRALLLDASALRCGALLPLLRARRGLPLHAFIARAALDDLRRLRAPALTPDAPPLTPDARLHAFMLHGLLHDANALLGAPLPPCGPPAQHPDDAHRATLDALRGLLAQHPGAALVTADPQLLLDAELEGLRAGLCWPLPLPPDALLTSPWLDPLTLRLHHLPLRDLLADLTFYLGALTLEAPLLGSSTTRALQPGLRTLALGALRRVDPCSPLTRHAATTAPPLSTPPAPPRAAPPPPPPPPPRAALSINPALPPLPEQSPSAETLVRALLRPDPPANPNLDPWLTHLGWLLPSGEAWTPRGRALADHGRALTPAAALEWCAWMDELARDAATLRPVRRILDLLEQGPLTDDQLTARLRVSDRTAERLLRLATHLGVLVRHRDATSRPDDPARLEGMTLDLLRDLQRHNLDRSTTIPIEALWDALVTSSPAPPHRLRRVLLQLHRTGRIRPVGARTRNTGIRWSLLTPDGQGSVKLQQIDPGRGDFLIPRHPAQDLDLAPNTP